MTYYQTTKNGQVRAWYLGRKDDFSFSSDRSLTYRDFDPEHVDGFCESWDNVNAIAAFNALPNDAQVLFYVAFQGAQPVMMVLPPGTSITLPAQT